MFLKILLITLGMLAFAFLFMSVQIMFSRKKRFPETHVGRNPHMQEKGIGCAKCESMGSCHVKFGGTHTPD